MSSFKSYLQSKGLAKSTVEVYLKRTLDFISWLDGENMEVEQVRQADVLAYFQKRRVQGLSQKSIQKLQAVLKHYFAWQIDCEIREDNPAHNLRLQGVNRQVLHKILSWVELEAIYSSYQLNEASKNSSHFSACPDVFQRSKAMLGLLIYQGVNTGELRQLAVSDLLLKEGKIYIPGGRKSNERTIELKAQQVVELMQYSLASRAELLKKYNVDTTALFVSGEKGGNLGNVLSRLLSKLKQQHPKLTNFKQVRASVITHWLTKHNLRETQYLAGHRYISSTETYKLGRLEDLQTDVDKYHPLGELTESVNFNSELQ